MLFLHILVAAVVLAAPDPKPDSSRTLSQSVILEAPVEDVWAGFTTEDGIVKSWAVAHADVDFRIGGTIRTNYSEQGAIGDPGTITHHIISYEPERMLSFRTDAPAGALEEVKDFCTHGWWVVRLEPISPGRTRLTETGIGFDGPLGDKAYAFFEKGNAWTHDHMKEAFRPSGESERVTKTWDLVCRLEGGEWISENKAPDGGVFRVRNRTEWGPGRKSLVSRGWLGDSVGLFEHGSTQVWLDAPSNQVRFHSIHETGSVAASSITLIDDHTVEWDWPEAGPSGTPTSYLVRMAFDGPDKYHFTLDQLEDGGRTTIVSADFNRVPQAPPEFLRLKGAEPRP